MPAPRFWAFEDARIDLGAVGGGADDIARMLLIGFSVDYGNDWFVVPVELPVGSITRIESLDVTDTFGVTSRVRSASEADGAAAAWRMFGLSTDDGSVAELLFVPPVLAGSLEAAAARACRLRPRRVRQPRVGDRGGRRVSDRRTTTPRRGAATADPHDHRR